MPNVTCMWYGCIQFNYNVELTMVECPSNIYTSMQRDPYTPEKVPPIPSPFLVI